jgi:hypothetical protein
VSKVSGFRWTAGIRFSVKQASFLSSLHHEWLLRTKHILSCPVREGIFAGMERPKSTKLTILKPNDPTCNHSKSKGEVVLVRNAMKTHGDNWGAALPFLASALDGAEQSALSPGRFIPGEITRNIFRIGGWKGLKAAMDAVEKCKVLRIAGFESKPSQPLQRLRRYVSSVIVPS